MFELLLAFTGIVIAVALLCAWDGSGYVLHPLFLICPMMMFLYVWMPLRLYTDGHLDGFFDTDQLVYAQLVNLLGVTAVMVGALSVGFAKRTASFRNVELPG